MPLAAWADPTAPCRPIPKAGAGFEHFFLPVHPSSTFSSHRRDLQGMPGWILQCSALGSDKGEGLAPATRFLEPDPCFSGLQGSSGMLWCHPAPWEPADTPTSPGLRGREEEELEGAEGRAGVWCHGEHWAEVRDEQEGSPGWMFPTLGGRGWVEEAAAGLRNGAANPAGQCGLWATSIPTPPCCHRCSPSTLQLQEVLVEQIFLLLQSWVLQGLGMAPEL